MSVCQCWHPCPVISTANFARSTAGWKALAGTWWGAERKREKESHVAKLLFFWPHFDVVVDEGFFLNLFSGVTSLSLVVLSCQEQK